MIDHSKKLKNWFKNPTFVLFELLPDDGAGDEELVVRVGELEGEPVAPTEPGQHQHDQHKDLNTKQSELIYCIRVI